MLDNFLRRSILLIEPIGFLWLCLIVLTFLLLRRRQWLPGLLSTGLVLLVFTIGATDLPGALLRALERPFANVDVARLSPADAVVMLGGGIEPSRYEVGGFHLTGAGDRLLMAADLMRRGKAPVLVLGGGAARLDGQVRAESELVGRWITDWELMRREGQARAEVISLGTCRDTHDEAVKVSELVRARSWQRVLLVTSASHMRRALATFRAAGVPVEAAPCNFLTTLSTAPPKAGISLPRYEGFEKCSVWLHEQIGWLEYRRKGWIPAAGADLRS